MIERAAKKPRYATWRAEAGRWAVWFAFMASARTTRRGWHKTVRPDKQVPPGYLTWPRHNYDLVPDRTEDSDLP